MLPWSAITQCRQITSVTGGRVWILIAGTVQYGTASAFQFDVTRDGQRFFTSTTGSVAPPRYTVIENWQDQFQK
jgi:hypothetical protein